MINNNQCIKLVINILYSQFMMHGQKNIKSILSRQWIYSQKQNIKLVLVITFNVILTINRNYFTIHILVTAFVSKNSYTFKFSLEVIKQLIGRLMRLTCKGKGKAVPLEAWSDPEGSRNLRYLDFMTTAQDGGKVVSRTHRPPLPPENTLGTHFCQRLSRPEGHSATGGIMSLKNSNDTIGNQTRDLPVCSVVP